MRKHAGRMTVAVVSLGLLILPATSARAQKAPVPVPLPPGLSQLKVDPYEGHQGDPLYLSGHNFLPNIRLLIYRACPNWHTIEAYKQGNIGWDLSRPETDSHGDFAGVRLDNLYLNGIESSACTFYASYPPDSRLPDTNKQQIGLSFFQIPELPASYYVERNSITLPARATQIQAQITPKPHRIKAGLFEQIAIDRGWGGARATVTVQFPHSGRPATMPVTLDWNGHASVRVPVPPGIPVSTRVRISVRFRLGAGSGSAHSSFIVVH